MNPRTVAALPPIALGTMRVSGWFNGLMVLDRDETTAVRLLRLAHGMGVRVFDTAPIYARGWAELDLARALRDLPDCRIWTKTGVDISGVLPQLDYSPKGLIRGYETSLNRLSGLLPEAVFVHNPSSAVLHGLDFEALQKECSGLTPQVRVGVSVLTGAHLYDLLASNLPQGAPVMVEAATLAAEPALTAKVRRRFDLVVRSLFDGGERIRGVSPQQRPGAIAESLRELRRRLRPTALVIAPRTTAQLAQYRPALQGLGPALDE